MPTDTPQIREQKIKQNNKNHELFDKIRSEKFDEIVSILDLFNGQLSLNDILCQDLPIITKLKEAKLRYSVKVNQEKQKVQAAEQEKMMKLAQKNNNKK